MIRISITILLGAVLLANQVEAVTHHYDDAGRLTRTTHPTGEATIYTYDDADNLLSVENVSVPVAPAELSVTRQSGTSAQVRWQDLADTESGYRIERRDARNYEWESIATLQAGVTQFIDPALEPDTTYVYRVHALGEDDLSSSYSAEVAAAGEDSERFSIRSFTQVAGATPFDLEIQFNSVNGATYRIEASESLEPDSWETYDFSLSAVGPDTQSEIEGTGAPLLLYVPTSKSTLFYRLMRTDS